MALCISLPLKIVTFKNKNKKKQLLKYIRVETFSDLPLRDGGQ